MAAQLTRIDCEESSEVDGDVRSECKEDEETYCEDGDSDTDW